MARKRVAAVIIGDEILSGKIADKNTSRLVEMVHAQGSLLERVVIIGDVLATIAREVRYAADNFDYVVTSGGLGPTHDDRTMEAIALGFEVPLVAHPTLSAEIEAHFGDRINAAARRMAQTPQGAVLVGDGPFPTVRFHNVFILPGVPQIFEAKLKLVAAQLDDQPMALARVYLNASESALAAQLSALEADHGVKVGSYPRIDGADHRMMVTLEADGVDAVRAAVAQLVDGIAAERVVRIEGP